jgi:hypothetical protein
MPNSVAAVPPVIHNLRLHAVAFREGDAWVIQGIEYDIVAHAYDVMMVPDTFMRAVMENVLVTTRLGRKPLEGINPAPAHFRTMFDEADGVEMRPIKKPQEWPDLEVRVAA